MIEFDISNIASIAGILHAVIESGNGMLVIRIRLVIVVDTGDAILAIFTVNTSSTGFRLDDSRGLAIFTILAFRTNKANGTIFAILTIMTENNIIQTAMEGFVDFAARDKLLRSVLGRIVRSRLRRICNLASTDSRSPSIFVGCLFCIRCCGLAIRTFQVSPDVGCIDIGFHAFQFLQLCDIDGIGVVCTCCYTVNLTGYCTISGTNGYSTGSCIPDRGSLIGRLSLRGRIIATYLFSRSCYYRSTANGYAAFSADFCVMADGYDVRSFRFIVGGIGRTDNDVVLLVRQLVVIPKDNVGLVQRCSITSYGIVSTDEVIVLAVSQSGIETFHIVQLRTVGAVCITAAGNRVANAGDLRHIGVVNCVATAHNHDLTAAGRNSILQILSHSRCIVLSEILLNLAQVELRGINSTIRIGDRVACTIDDGSIRVSRCIGLADDTVGYATMFFGGIRVLVDVEGTIGQRRCTAEVQTTIAILVENT